MRTTVTGLVMWWYLNSVRREPKLIKDTIADNYYKSEIVFRLPELQPMLCYC